MKRAALLALLSAACAAGQEMLTEVVGGEDFSFPRLARLARARLQDRTGPVTRITLFAAEPSPYYLTQSPFESFGAWLSAWKSASKMRWRVAEAISIGGDASLRIRIGRSVSRLTLAGRDPLLLTVDGRRYEILHLSSAAPGTLAVYVRGPKPLPCEALLRRLRQSVPLKVELRMRTDHWFLHDPGFPPYYWFQPADPPTRDAVASGAQAACGG